MFLQHFVATAISFAAKNENRRLHFNFYGFSFCNEMYLYLLCKITKNSFLTWVRFCLPQKLPKLFSWHITTENYSLPHNHFLPIFSSQITNCFQDTLKETTTIMRKQSSVAEVELLRRSRVELVQPTSVWWTKSSLYSLLLLMMMIIKNSNPLKKPKVPLTTCILLLRVSTPVVKFSLL